MMREHIFPCQQKENIGQWIDRLSSQSDPLTTAPFLFVSKQIWKSWSERMKDKKKRKRKNCTISNNNLKEVRSIQKHWNEKTHKLQRYFLSRLIKQALLKIPFSLCSNQGSCSVERFPKARHTKTPNYYFRLQRRVWKCHLIPMTTDAWNLA